MKKMEIKRGRAALAVLAALVLLQAALLTGCASIQKDVVRTTDSFVQDEDIVALEQRLALLDADNILTGSVSSNTSVYFESEALIKDIEYCITATGMNEPVTARLYAMEGLVYVLQGRSSKGKLLYNKSNEAGKGDSYTVILGFRLGLIESLVDENIVSGSNQNALLELEQGLAYYRDGEYAKCVAGLDSAFINLPLFYKSAYSKIRQKAWDLRNTTDVTDNNSILTILNKSQITIGEMILITQETTDLLYVINGGKSLSETELFSQLAIAGYFNAASEPETKPKQKALKKSQLVDRQLCARFLWNVYCVKKNYTSQKTKNSEVYRKKVHQSPIPDVELYSEDFDAILGVVENEIMDLPDGQNFAPAEMVAASDFNAWLLKIK